MLLGIDNHNVDDVMCNSVPSISAATRDRVAGSRNRQQANKLGTKKSSGRNAEVYRYVQF